MWLRRLVLVVTVACAGGALVAAGSPTLHYKFVTYDAPGWANAQVQGINNLGLLSGTAYNEDGSVFTGVLWVGGKADFVNVPGQGPFGTILYQVNDLGQAAGNYYDDNGLAHAVVYDLFTKRFKYLPDVPGASFNAAGGIALTGEVAGDYTFDPSQAVGFVGWLYDDGRYHDFVDPKSDQDVFGTATYSMNDFLTIVGLYEDAAGKSHGFIKPVVGPFIPYDVPTAGPLGTQIFGINNTGAIAGRYYDAQGNSHGFVLDGNRLTTVDFPGSSHTAVASINDLGDIGGWYNDAAGNQHGFVGRAR